MDVGRIEPISPYKINWQKLTAKEIIKYEEQGVEVPSQYLSWAKDFQQTISESNDETTYEKAATQVNTLASGEKPSEVQSNETDEENEVDENADTAEKPEEEKTEAQLKHEQMIKDGDSILQQGRVFRRISNENRKEMKIGEMVMNLIAVKSTDEISKLDSYMGGLIKEIQTNQSAIKNEISNVNEGKGNLQNINNIQEKLTKLGNNGIQKATATEAMLKEFEKNYNDIAPDILSSADYGVETVIIGQDIKKMGRNEHIFPFFTIIGNRTIKKGEQAISSSLDTAEARATSKNINDANIEHSDDYNDQITEATGVANPKEEKAKTENTNSEQEEKTQETETEKAAKGENDSENVAVNNGNDNQDKLTTDLNEILKRKIRKGENVDNSNS